MREESFAPEFKDYINSFINNSATQTKMDQLYERSYDFNQIQK